MCGWKDVVDIDSSCYSGCFGAIVEMEKERRRRSLVCMFDCPAALMDPLSGNAMLADQSTTTA